MRDPRGYIIPSDQPDFANAAEFVNALLKNGIDIHARHCRLHGGGQELSRRIVRRQDRAGLPPARAWICSSRRITPTISAIPAVRPIRPYDITGWTLAIQMGVKFDRILDGFDGPFTKIGTVCCRRRDDRQRTHEPGRLSDQPRDQQFVQADQPPAQGQLPTSTG